MLLTLIRSVGLAVALAELKRRVRAMAQRGVLGFVGAIVFVIALCFFLVAAHLYLSSLLNPIASAAIIGGVLLLIALILFFLASRPIDGKARASGDDQAAQLGDAIKDGAARIGDAFSGGGGGGPLQNPVLLAAGFALFAGFLLGRQGRRRRRDDE
jgi:energy-coupling factor transporter transmembrane protein EcfT